MMMLADRLRGLRGTESQTAFAARFGLKQAIYSHYETGRKKPSLEVLVEMAKVLGATTDYLLGLSDIPPAPAPSALSAPPRETKIRTGDNSPVAIGTNIIQTFNQPKRKGKKKDERQTKDRAC